MDNGQRKSKQGNGRRYRISRWLRPPASLDVVRLQRAFFGKTLLITGASSGIGAATARLLGQAGVRILLVARNEERLEEVCQHVRAQGAEARSYIADFTQAEQVLALVQSILSDYPVIDAVISNAGKSIRRNLVDTGLRTQDVLRCSQVNYTSPVLLLTYILPGMLARGSGQVINVSTVSARLPAAPYWSAYQSSKCAFDVWFQSAAAELHTDGLNLGSVYLPLVHTPMSAPSVVFQSVPGMSAEDAAATVAYALLSRQRRVAPWWLWPCEWMSIVLRRPLDAVMSRLYLRRGSPRPGGADNA
jgi:short-subunit dehydrogenase